jgi:hypothetical protein
VVALVLLSLAGGSAGLAAGEDVTFENKSKRHQELLVAYGEDGRCAKMPTEENVSLDPGESKTVSSGAGKVCWCAGSGKARVGQCDQWSTTKAGKTVKIKS